MTTKKTGGSQQPSKGRGQGRGHSKHTASTTPQQGTGEGGSRGTDKERHHAPRHAPPRHHTRRTHPHPRPQRVASGPRQPAQRAGSREGGAPEPRRPPPPPWRAAPRRAREPRGQCRAPTPAHPHPQHVGGGPRQPARRAGSRGRGSAGTQTPLTTAKGTPPRGRPSPPPQRATPARKGARCGAGAGPHPHTNRIRNTRVAEPRLPAPEDGRSGEGERLTPDAPHNGGTPPPPGMAPHHPRGTQPQQGKQAKGTVLGPHARTTAPTARGWRTPTARPEGGQSGEGVSLTSDAPQNGERHPPRGRPSATPTARNAIPQGRTLRGRCWVPTPSQTTPGTHRSRNPGCPPQRTGGRGRDSA